MGKVFSAEEIQNEQYPEPGAHSQAGEYLLQKLFTEAGTLSGVESAIVYGSAVEGRSIRRSDLDVLVNYRLDNGESALPFIQSAFSEVEDRHKVPIEANVLHTGALISPLTHSVDFMYARYLADSQSADTEGRWSRNNPLNQLFSNMRGKELWLDVFSSTEALAGAVMLRYASGKMRLFARAITEFKGDIEYHNMQRALELPIALGRKALGFTIAARSGKNVEHIIFPGPMSEDTAEDALQAAISEMKEVEDEEMIPLQGASGKFAELIKMDAEYTALLESVITGETTIQDYANWLRSNYQRACLCAHESAAAWVEIVNLSLSASDYEQLLGLGSREDGY